MVTVNVKASTPTRCVTAKASSDWRLWTHFSLAYILKLPAQQVIACLQKDQRILVFRRQRSTATVANACSEWKHTFSEARCCRRSKMLASQNWNCAKPWFIFLPPIDRQRPPKLICIGQWKKDYSTRFKSNGRLLVDDSNSQNWRRIQRTRNTTVESYELQVKSIIGQYISNAKKFVFQKSNKFS